MTLFLMQALQTLVQTLVALPMQNLSEPQDSISVGVPFIQHFFLLRFCQEIICTQQGNEGLQIHIIHKLNLELMKYVTTEAIHLLKLSTPIMRR